MTTKNKALALATGEYVLFMDADERLLAVRKRCGRWRKPASGTRSAGGSSTGRRPTRSLRNMTGCGCGVTMGVGFSAGRACTRSSVRRPARVLRDPGVVVWHDHRHRDNESFVKRSEWYVELLQAALQRDPGDTRALFYLARTFKDLGRWFEAIEAYERYLAAGGWHDERWQACYDLALCWRELGEWGQARDVCRRALGLIRGGPRWRV